MNQTKTVETNEAYMKLCESELAALWKNYEKLRTARQPVQLQFAIQAAMKQQAFIELAKTHAAQGEPFLRLFRYDSPYWESVEYRIHKDSWEEDYEELAEDGETVYCSRKLESVWAVTIYYFPHDTGGTYLPLAKAWNIKCGSYAEAQEQLASLLQQPVPKWPKTFY